MRLVTDDPAVYFTWVLWSIAGIAALVGIMFLIAWIQVYVIPVIKKWGKK